MINEGSNQYGNVLYAANTSPLTGLAGITQSGQNHTKQSKKTKNEENSLLPTFLMEDNSGDSEPPPIRVFGPVGPVEPVGSGGGEKSGRD